MSTRAKVFLGLGLYVALIVVAVFVFGFARVDNEEFQPQNEFQLDTWFSIGPLPFNKASLYVIIAGVLTVGTMMYVADRMQARPNRVQTAVEVLYTLMRDNIAGENMDRAMLKKWFTFIGTIFLFIWFSNLIGYIPLPTNTEHTVDICGEGASGGRRTSRGLFGGFEQGDGARAELLKERRFVGFRRLEVACLDMAEAPDLFRDHRKADRQRMIFGI